MSRPDAADFIAPPCEGFEHQRVAQSVLQKLFGAPAPAFGAYTHVELLKRATKDTVYRAHDPQHDRAVAIKALNLPPEGKQALIDRRLHEARTTSKLAHPNILDVVEIGTLDGQPYIVMAFCERGQIAASPITAPEGAVTPLPIFAKLARAIHFAHEAGVVHGDIKPSRILVDAEGEPQLGGFGGAREIEGGLDTRLVARWPAGQSITLSSGIVAGTPAYMAPEQLREGTIDEDGDQYSFFATLNELLLEDRPKGTLPLPRSLARTVERVVQRGMSRNPLHRYESMACVAEILERLEDSFED